MNKRRRQIEEVKDDFRKQIEADVLRFKRSVIREVDYAYRQLKNSGQDVDMQALLDKVFKRLRISKAAQNIITKDVKEVQAQIADIHDLYFEKDLKLGKEITFNNNDYEKLVAANQVDFSVVDKTIKDAVKTEFVKSIRDEYSFSQLRSKLIKRDVGDATAYTQANTIVAQFDNAYMVENAQQAGVQKFKYDGSLKVNTRPFCRERLGKLYTLAQLEKMDNGQGLPVLYSLGGYNCTHYLTPEVE